MFQNCRRLLWQSTSSVQFTFSQAEESGRKLYRAIATNTSDWAFTGVFITPFSLHGISQFAFIFTSHGFYSPSRDDWGFFWDQGDIIAYIKRKHVKEISGKNTSAYVLTTIINSLGFSKSRGRDWHALTLGTCGFFVVSVIGFTMTYHSLCRIFAATPFRELNVFFFLAVRAATLFCGTIACLRIGVANRSDMSGWLTLSQAWQKGGL